MKREVVRTTAVGSGNYVLVGKRPPYENRNYPGVDCRVKTMPRILVRFAVCACILAVSAAAQQSRITEPIDDTARVILPGSVRSKARLSDDQGPADPSLQIPFITLSMKPSAAQQADLDRLLEEQRDRSSSKYHQWLRPEQFGDRFGLTSGDYAAVTAWLESHGLHMEYVARARNWVAFSGAAHDVERAFHTQIHRYLVDGQAHFANSTAVSIPAALAGIASGIRGLDDFWRVAPAPFPDNTTASGVNQLAPDDWATIYDVSPLYAMGIDGTGQRIGILGGSDMDQSYINTFRSQFGLPPTTVEQHLVGPDPGITASANEAALDVEWSGAIARRATIVYIYSANFNTAAQGAVDQNLATVLSESLSSCEPEAAAGNRLMAQQANAQGITWMASSDDSGPAGCDAHGFFGTTGNATTVSDGPAVGIPASYPEVTAVGGTEFNEAGGHYWNSSNTANSASAISYIPEMVRNETGAGGLLASGGGPSIFFSTPPWQAGPGVPADNARDVPDISFSAAGNHDPYMVVNSNGQRATGGTSASSPSFAGVVALLNHYLVSSGVQSQPGLGNINPELYRLARTTTNVFHDITQGNNFVPCAAGSPGCVNGSMGYAASPGYDLATGLGSLDVYNFVTQWNTTAAGTTISLAASPSSITFGNPVQLIAPVTPVAGSGTVPSGTVAFSTGRTLLGIGPIVNAGGVALATLTVTGSVLPVGSARITAAYSGDSNFNSSTGSTTVSVAPGATGSYVSVNISPNPAHEGEVIRGTLTGEAGVILAMFLPLQNQPLVKCSLSGTVVNSVTGEPLNKVDLRLEPLNRQATPVAVTKSDAEGRFALVDLDPGSYRLIGNRNGYFDMSYGARRPDSDGSLVRLEKGQSLNGLNFKLTPSAVISGTVRDSDGEPLEGAHVILAHFTYRYGRPRVEVCDSTDTDDRGEYRFRGLAAGKYYVGVEPKSPGWDRVDHSASAGPSETSVPTVYPGVTDLAAAAPIEVSTGRRVTGIDVTLLRSRVFRVSGRVVNAPAAGRLTVVLFEAKNAGMRDYNIRTSTKDATGNFEFRGVPPGSYELTVGEQSLRGRAPVVVSASDLEDIRVPLSPGAEIKLRIITEGADKPNVSGLDVFLTADGRSGFGPGLRETDRLTVRNVPPDHYDLKLAGLPREFYVKTARAGETDVLADGLTVRGAGTIDIDIAVSS